MVVVVVVGVMVAYVFWVVCLNRQMLLEVAGCGSYVVCRQISRLDCGL
jgi:hypothetical protein